MSTTSASVKSAGRHGTGKDRAGASFGAVSHAVYGPRGHIPSAGGDGLRSLMRHRVPIGAVGRGHCRGRCFDEDDVGPTRRSTRWNAAVSGRQIARHSANGHPSRSLFPAVRLAGPSGVHRQRGPRRQSPATGCRRVYCRAISSYRDAARTAEHASRGAAHGVAGATCGRMGPGCSGVVPRGWSRACCGQVRLQDDSSVLSML